MFENKRNSTSEVLKNFGREIVSVFQWHSSIFVSWVSKSERQTGLTRVNGFGANLQLVS